MNEKSAKAFIDWLQKNDPFLYAVAVKASQLKKESNQKNLGGIFDLFSGVNFVDLAKSAVQTVKDVAPTVIQYQQQKKLLDAQVKRANQGLPPLDTAGYMVSVPAYNPNAPTPEQQQMINQLAYQSVNQPSNTTGKNIVLFGVLGLGAALLVKLLRGKK